MCFYLDSRQDNINYTQSNTLGAFAGLSYFGYTSHIPCSVLLLLLFLIPVKKEDNVRWLKVKEKSKLGVTIFVLKEPDPVDLHTLFFFFNLRKHHPLVSTSVFPFNVFIPSKVFLWSQSGLSVWSWRCADTQPMGNFSVFLCCAGVLIEMWVCHSASPHSNLKIVDAKWNTVKQTIFWCWRHQRKSSQLSLQSQNCRMLGIV